MALISRRKFLGASGSVAALSLAGCARPPAFSRSAGTPSTTQFDIRRVYAARPEERYAVPAVDLSRLHPAYYRRLVQNTTGQRPGTVVVDTAQRYLYVTLPDGFAMRYGVGIGREGFEWSGEGYVGRKAEWPVWTPPSAMIERQPELEKYRNGMAPGPENPLGARALYIYVDGRDTLYRLHGNPDETSIGRAVSSGCVRLLQQDVIDLYDRVDVGVRVVVL